MVKTKKRLFKICIAVIIVLGIIAGLVYDYVFYVPTRNRLKWGYEEICGYEISNVITTTQQLRIWKFDEKTSSDFLNTFVIARYSEDAQWAYIYYYDSIDEAKSDFDTRKENEDLDKDIIVIRRGRAIFYGTKGASYYFRFAPY